MSQFNETSILDALQYNCGSGQTYWIRNAYIFGGGVGWESDFMTVQKSGYCIEYEVKISRADFFCDFKKIRHTILGKGVYVDSFNREARPTLTPNKFFYVVPEGLISPDEIPDHAGLIYVQEVKNNEYRSCKAIMPPAKMAPLLHKTKLSLQNKLCNKFFWALTKMQAENKRLILEKRGLMKEIDRLKTAK